MDWNTEIYKFLWDKKRLISIALASLIAFLGADFIIKSIFPRNVQLISLNFLVSSVSFIFFVAIYYGLIIIVLSNLIEKGLVKLIDKYRFKIHRVAIMILIFLLLLGIVFNYKYTLFDPIVSNWLENNLPWISNLK